ncbi:MAG: hypothetical protein ACI9BK_002632, partial [Acidimicrobiales bacterium]
KIIGNKRISTADHRFCSFAIATPNTVLLNQRICDLRVMSPTS